MPLKVGTYSITSNAFATGYTPLSSYQEFCVVDPTVNVTITKAGYQIDSTTFKDPRDGKTYYLATTGGNVWMQNNLGYQDSGVSYGYCSAVDPIFGKLYTWNEAIKACPDGWHLPSDADFVALTGTEAGRGETIYGAAGSLMADAYFLGNKMWTYWPDVKITNKSKFSALPIGYAIDREDSQHYVGINDYAVFWTSDEDGESAFYRYIYEDKDNLYSSKGSKDYFRASVRCVKD